MVLVSYQNKEITYEEVVADLLSFNNSWVNPTPLYLSAIKDLVSKNLIIIKESHFIQCVNLEDTFDLPNLIDYDCRNEILIYSDFDESCDDMICDNCGRYILPNTFQKQRFHMLSISINRLAIVQWFEEGLVNTGYIWRRSDIGIYHLLGEKGFINVIIADLCQDPSYLTIDKLRVHPTIIVTLKKKPLLPLNVNVVTIASLICKISKLSDVIAAAIKQGAPQLLPNTSAVVLISNNIPLTKPQPMPLDRTFQISIVNGSVCINSIEIINKQAKSRIYIFRILLEQYLQDFAEGLPAESHTLLSINQIAKLLEPYLGNIDDVEQQVRRPLNKIQKGIEEIISKEIGLNIKRNDIIQTLGWPGFTKKRTRL
jgi:hypothetical protein